MKKNRQGLWLVKDMEFDDEMPFKEGC